MKHKTFLIITVLVALLSCNTNTDLNKNPKREFHVYLNENQCLYCYNYVISLNELPKGSKLLFYTSEKSFDTWNELFSHMKITKKYEFRAYEKTITSNFVEIYQNQVKTDSFPIEKLPKRINEFNAQNNNFSIQDSITLEGFTLSSRNTINVQDDHLVFCDYLLNTAHIVDLQTKTIQKINGADFNTDEFLDLIEYNEKEYKKWLPKMKKQNLDKVKIASTFYHNDTITIVSTLGIPLVQGENIAIQPNFFIGNYANNKWSYLFYPTQIFTHKENMYSIYDKVYRYGSNFITNLITPTLHPQNALWAKFKKDNKQLSVEVLDHTHPEIVSSEQLYPHSSMGVGNDWLFLNYFPIAFNPKTNEILNYSNYLQDTLIENPVDLSSAKLIIVDLYAYNQNMSVIYKSGGEYYLIKFNTVSKESLFTKSLNIPKKIESSTIRFVSEQEFCALADDRKNIYFLSF